MMQCPCSWIHPIVGGFSAGEDFPPVTLSQAKPANNTSATSGERCSGSSVPTPPAASCGLNHTVGIVLEWSVQVFSALTSHRHNYRQHFQLSADYTVLSLWAFFFLLIFFFIPFLLYVGSCCLPALCFNLRQSEWKRNTKSLSLKEVLPRTFLPLQEQKGSKQTSSC